MYSGFTGWIRVETTKAVATIDVVCGIIHKTAPIFKWAIGKTLLEFLRSSSYPIVSVRFYDKENR